MAEEFPPLLVRCLVAHVEHPPSRNEIVHRCFHVVAGLTVNLLHTIHAGEAEFARADLHVWTVRLVEAVDGASPISRQVNN